MSVPRPESLRELAEAAWSWCQAQVRRDPALWLPEHPDQSEPGEDPFGMHSGVGGLAHLMAEIRLTRPLTGPELELGDAIADTVTARIPTETEYDYFVGLTSTLGILTALDAPGLEAAIARLSALATPDGWAPSFLDTLPNGRVNDATLGTGAVLLGATWAQLHGVAGAAELAHTAAAILLSEREVVAPGWNWPFIPTRLVTKPQPEMPNWSHGVAGVAGALAAAGVVLAEPDWVEAARLGAEHLITLGDTSDGGFRVPHVIPDAEDLDTFTYSWCHGPTGTSLAFAALRHAGVESVGGRSPEAWERACLHSLRVSGIPERRHPGFWDNDGRCCGTAGAGDAVLTAWQRGGDEGDLAFAVGLGEALVARAIRDGEAGQWAYWRFVEHRNADPLLPPGPGWMQGAAGIAAYLFRLARALEQGREAAAVPRMDTWWTLPGAAAERVGSDGGVGGDRGVAGPDAR